MVPEAGRKIGKKKKKVRLNYLIYSALWHPLKNSTETVGLKGPWVFVGGTSWVAPLAGCPSLRGCHGRRYLFSFPPPWRPSQRWVSWTMAYWLRPVICCKVSRSVCRACELEMLPEEPQCYWKLLWKEDPPPPAREIHRIALVLTLSEPGFNSSLDLVR